MQSAKRCKAGLRVDRVLRVIALAIRRLLTATAATTAGPDAEPAAETPRREPQRRWARSHPIDKSVLTLSTPRRYRNKEHLRYVARQPPSDPHHLQFVQPRALGRKIKRVSERSVPNPACP